MLDQKLLQILDQPATSERLLRKASMIGGSTIDVLS
jgi:hypothetical protein